MLYPSAIEGEDFDEEEVSSDEEIQPIKAKKSAPVLRNECKTFDALNLSRSILKAVLEAGFFEPTPIQSACIPVALSGRDICACASTGTGKTAAFMLPILERLLYKPRGQRSTTRVLVLVPTRELAIQVFEVSRRLGKYTNVEICLAVGGLDIKAQEAALRLGLDIVIATPGRLVDHLHNSPNFSLANIEVLVLDEADRMLDEQFMDQMKEIIKLCSYNRQTMLFSATLTEKVEDLVNLSLKKPVKLFINEETDLALNLHQEFVRIRNDEKVRRREAIVAALVMNTFSNHSIIFIRTKHACERMNVLLRLLGVKVGRLHGGLTQTQRVETLQAFRRQQDVQVLCATDLAARGLDIEGVLTVINMHMPSTLKQYIHRVGRTARAGKAGRSISLIGEEDRKLMKEILKMNTKGKGPAAGNRKIEPNVVDSLMKQIEELRPKVDKILEDEKYEKQFKQAEKSIKEVEQKLKSLDAVKKPIVKPERKRFKSDKRNQKIAGQNGKRMSKGRKREEKKERKFGHSSDPAKRGKHKERAKPTGGKSSFTAEIADITQRAIKRHRHGPDDQEFKKLKREKDGARGGKERTKRK